MILTFFILICVCLAVLLTNWRWGIYLIILAGFIQDPVRKVIEGQPVAYSTVVIFVFALSLLLAFMANNSWRVRHLTLDNPHLEFSMGLYILFVIFSSSYSFVSYGNPTIAIIGISIYLGPIVAAVYASLVFDNYKAIASFITFYLIGIGILNLTIWLSVFGVEYKILEEIGGGIDIYEHSIRGYLDVHSGIARTSEIAAWHLATGACFSLILAVHVNGGLKKIILYLLTIACLFSGIFTGRRKMYALFAIFCLTLLLLALYESKAKHKNFVFLATIIICIITISLYAVFQKQILMLSFASDYLSRAFTLFGDTTDRLSTTAGSFTYTLQNIEFIGDGIGSTGQGVADFSARQSSWNAETGLGRLGNELGVLGLIIIVVMLVMLFSHIVVTDRIIKRQDFQLSFFQRSLMAFLFANAINYFNAAQAYNDLFILLILGLTLGCVLSTPKIFYKAATRLA